MYADNTKRRNSICRRIEMMNLMWKYAYLSIAFIFVRYPKSKMLLTHHLRTNFVLQLDDKFSGTKKMSYINRCSEKKRRKTWFLSPTCVWIISSVHMIHSCGTLAYFSLSFTLIIYVQFSFLLNQLYNVLDDINNNNKQKGIGLENI